MGSVQVGDTLFDETGKPCTVTYVSPVQLGNECFDVHFSDGSMIVADAEHLWETSDYAQRKAYGRARVRRPLAKTIRTTREISATLHYNRRGDVNHSVENQLGLILPAAALPIEPYVLGAWLGDGSSHAARLTTADSEVLGELVAAGCGVGVGRKKAVQDKCATHWIGSAASSRDGTTGQMKANGSLHSALKALDLLRNKHVPSAYLRASKTQRLALLQGLMDTDGSAETSGRCRFDNTRKVLADAVYELVCSLGWKATSICKRAVLNGIDQGPCYRVSFYPGEPVFRLARKLARQTFGQPREASRTRRYIVEVKRRESCAVRCIAVDSPSRMFLAGRAFIPTHNTATGLQMVTRGHGAYRGQLKGARDGGKVWWVAPAHPVASEIWRDLKRACRDTWTDKSEVERRIELPGGGSVTVKSADNPDSLRGTGLDGIVIDEAASIREEAWKQALRPSLSDRQGWAVFIGTPRGFNWFHDLFREAEYLDGWRRWQRPSSDNPLLDATELAAAHADIGGAAYSQEYGAAFTTTGLGMFHREWLPIIEAASAGGQRVRAWDKAGTDGGGDYSAGVLLSRVGPFYFVLDVQRGQWSSHARNEIIRQTAELDGRATKVWVEQEPGSSGKESAEFTIQQLAGYIVAAERSTGDKATRAAPFASQCEAGNVKLIRGEWNRAFIDELTLFPQGKHDDQVDAAALAFNKLCGPAPSGWGPERREPPARKEPAPEVRRWQGDGRTIIERAPPGVFR